jgi:hypothetical protein
MAMDAQMIAEMIRSGIPGAIVKIEDLRGDGEHYSAQVTSSTFKGHKPCAAAPDGLQSPARKNGGRASRVGHSHIDAERLITEGN